MKNNKVLVIGLDGVGPQLIQWAKENKLPNMAKIMKTGANGKLRSTMPAQSHLAWPSFYTGMNPGKHGVFGPEQLTDEGFKPVTFKSVSGESLWRIISEYNKKAIVIAVPITYPPESVNGILISGMDTPSEETNFTYPNDLKADLKRAQYKIFVNSSLYSHPEDLYREAIEVMQKKGEVALKLMKKYDWDFFILVLNETDVIAHFLPEKIFDCYQEADNIVGKMLAETGAEINTIIMSDHGSAVYERSLHLSPLLKQQMKEDNRELDKMTRLLGLFARFVVLCGRLLGQLLSTAVIRKIRYKYDVVDKFIETLGRLLSKTEMKKIKLWDKNIRIGTDTIYLLDKTLREPVRSKLNELSKQYDYEVYEKEDIYFGEFVNKAPDFVIYSEKHLPARGYGRKNILGPPKRPGGHSLHGIVAVSGKDIQNMEIIDAQIVDLAPTILHLMDLPIPKEMDGRVLKEIFIKDSELDKRRMKYQQLSERERLRLKIRRMKKLQN